MGTGTHLTLKTSEGDVDVRLGPSGYLSEKGLSLAEKDNIKVTGSKVSIENHSMIIASEVEKDGKVVVLRDKDGFPMWSGRNR